MFLKIEGHLLDVLGEGARRNIKEEFGIIVNPIYQFLDREPPVTLAQVVDQVKAEKLLSDSRVTKLDTVEQFNTEIDNLYEERYILKDSTELQIDLLLSGNPMIPNYDATKPLTDQVNLKALYNAGMGGIKKNKKPPYLTAK
ncbi:MAG: hypothetical protein H0Z35_09300 [Thermoanaerobacteraceae bacterium]|nr:hypothetical protein [Thermoanaerobacteraceae bacterium]